MRRIALCAVVLALVAASADARTWTVGGPGADFPLIAPAIAAASAGDVIRVRGGVYREDLVLDKPLALTGRRASDAVWHRPRVGRHHHGAGVRAERVHD